MATQDNSLKSVDDIDLERVVNDRAYRRRVIALLNRVETTPADGDSTETPDPGPSR